jgi:AcrR family transcriptional regulator
VIETGRPMRADAARNRARVLEVAYETFAAEGLSVPIDEIARRAGVGAGTVYRHFPTKEALIAEIVRQTFAAFARRAQEALGREGSAFEALSWLLHGNAEQLAGDAATRYALGGGTAVWEASAAEREELERLAAELIHRGCREGTLRQDLSVADIGMVMCGLASSIGRGFDWRRHLALMLDGMREPAKG